MKLLTSNVLAILQQKDMRRNIQALLKQLLVLVCFIAIYSVLFHYIMLREGQEHTWLTGVYWTLTVMSTLGFGDITFHTDLGRLFSILVLVSGLILILIMLPFAFIRHFYAPWVEAHIRLKAPRRIDPQTVGHVIICCYDAVANALITRLNLYGYQYFLLESDPNKALQYHTDNLNVVLGDRDAVTTWKNLNADQASLVVANLEETTNTIITLTLREYAPDVPLAAIVEDKDAVDILELSGADHVITLKDQLGQHLAAHASTGTVHEHHVGKLGSLIIAEFPIKRTQLAGLRIRKCGLRESTGVSIVAVWEHGRLKPAEPELVLNNNHVVVVVGTSDQMSGVSEMFATAEPGDASVLIIGGGKVGCAAAQKLKSQGVRVHVIEIDANLREALEGIADQVFIGNAANIQIMENAGVRTIPSVLLTTHDDATNIYLAIYARRLNPNCHIVSRITHEHNLDAIHRAGADFVLSESALGAKLLLSVLQKRELIVVGEHVDVFVTPLPRCLENKTLIESEIGAKTGLIVMGEQVSGETRGIVSGKTPLQPGSSLVILGTRQQREKFRRVFEA